ncbi:hypothetical protein [Hymenobacter siberiensis]|uniref:hypothetical protein n=1 Tax=Hymenobacter siberiensis TaxID=2848396 RepID=UPI001C1DD76F|nr:hypothetical protein [Hymenobacter siberiensis]
MAISEVGNMERFDALFGIVGKARTATCMMEAKVRNGHFDVRSMRDTFLTVSKFKALCAHRQEMGIDRLYHVAFYKGGAMLHDLTDHADGKKTFEVERVDVAQTNSEAHAETRAEDKYLMMHADGKLIPYHRDPATNQAIYYALATIPDKYL